MKTIISSIILAFPLILSACSNQVKGNTVGNELAQTDAADTSVIVDAATSIPMVKVPGDPTGDIEIDGKAIAEYVYAILPQLDSLDRKLKAHQDLMMNKTYNEGLSEVFKKIADDTNTDYRELPSLLKTEYPVGDMRKDGEIFAYLATKTDNYKADLGKILDKYDVYYRAKGIKAFYHQYRATVRRNLPKDFEPELFTDLSEEE